MPKSRKTLVNELTKLNCEIIEYFELLSHLPEFPNPTKQIAAKKRNLSILAIEDSLLRLAEKELRI